jgi:hypothetical protein
MGWVENEDNGLRQTRKMDDMAFRLQYKPLDYLLQQESVSLSNRAQRIKELEGMHYFNLTFLPNELGKGDLLKQAVGSQAEYQQALYYYSYQFNERLWLLQGQDTLPCTLFHFVRDHGLSPTLQFVLGFENKGINEDMQLVVHDDVFQHGLIKFSITKKQLHSIPTINSELL